MTTMQNGWAQGLNGTLYVTHSGGTSWIPLVPHADMHGLAPVGHSTLWYLGKITGTIGHYRMAVWRTINLGTTWQKTSIALPWIPTLTEIWATAPQRALITLAHHGQGSSSVQTIIQISGKSLSASIVLPPTPASKHQTADLAVSSAAGNHIWAVGAFATPNRVLWSVSHGRMIPVPLPFQDKLSPLDQANSVASTQSPTPGTSYLGVNYKPEGTNAHIPSEGMLYRWAHGRWEETWKTSGLIQQIQFVSRQVGWILINKGNTSREMHRTQNGGKTFTRLPPPPNSQFQFSNLEDGWSYTMIKHGRPSLWKTTDGGRHWTRVG